MKDTLRFELNNVPVELTLDRERMVLSVLRSDLGLTGAKLGCGEGHCGACTILVNNTPVRSCMFPISYVNGKNVTTIEGLARSGNLHPLQTAFIKHDALQCGFCTPGMILHAYGLLHKNRQPTRGEIIQSMDKNLCRCGSYVRIVEAIQTASREMEGVK
ncbi:MAG: (2Fe-2S)-binding protein [Candidatus Neomarinimicrobiota bacterium]